MSLVSARRQLLMLIAGYAQEVSSRRKDRQNRTHVDHSLTCGSEENSKFLCQAPYKNHHAQFEDDTLGNIQPVKVVVEDMTKTAV